MKNLPAENLDPAMTKNQKSLVTSGLIESFIKYKDFVFSSGNTLEWLLFEIYSIFIAPLPSFIGYGLRQLILPSFFLNRPKRLMVSPSVVLRNPKNIIIGNNVIIDKNVTIDVRSSMIELQNSCGVEIGNNVLLGYNSMVLAKNGKITLGNAVNVSSNCRIASEGPIEIGESCLISAYCYIGPGNHKYEDSSRPMIEQGMHKGEGVKIGKNVWIGARVTILDGITIGDNSIIGAHSFVNRNVPENSIYAGTPAKFVRNK